MLRRILRKFISDLVSKFAEIKIRGGMEFENTLDKIAEGLSGCSDHDFEAVKELIYCWFGIEDTNICKYHHKM